METNETDETNFFIRLINESLRRHFGARKGPKSQKVWHIAPLDCDALGGPARPARPVHNVQLTGICESDQSDDELGLKGSLTGDQNLEPPLLPGWKLPVRDLFAE